MAKIIKQGAANGARAEPVIRRSDYVYQCLFREIMSGQLEPGVRLREQEISDRLGISRTPVREALNRLVMDGVLQSIPNAGVMIRKYKPDELKDLFSLRAAFESLAVRLACEKGFSDRSLSDVKKANERLEARLEKDDDPGCYSADVEFHQKLIALANSSVISEAYAKSNISIVSWRRSDKTAGHLHRHRTALREHGEILAALEKRDAAKAAQLCERHILDGYMRLVETLLKTVDREL